MIPFDEAVARVRKAARPLGTEIVPLDRAAGRVLADPVRARIDSPRADVSVMDGYAVRESDLQHPPARMKVVGEAFPGSRCSARVEPGACVRIFTGAPLPPGTERVVIQEDVRRDGDFAIVDAEPGPARYVRARGSDFATGDMLLESGRLLDPFSLVAAAAGDVGELSVAVQPRIAILSNGDELVAPGTASQFQYAVPESVSPAIAALAETWGGLVICRRLLRDELSSLKEAAADALRSADLIVVTGGASLGNRDFAKAMFQDEGLDLLFARVAMKPGKPVWFGRAEGRYVLGLPGNPTSALVTARLLLAPLLCGLTGRHPADPFRWQQAPLMECLDPCGDRETFVRARWERGSVRPLRNQESGAQSALAQAGLLIRRRIGTPAATAGDIVEVIDL